MEHRGMKKWRPFAPMSEQYIRLKEMINKQAEVAQPVLTEAQMVKKRLFIISQH
ncbi:MULTISPECIES: hypothetical protein [Priestia]|uniref:hypothetical protein n=1 Tax=Priestia TaxID=2800373 RepID=UPI0003FDE33C|nr:MULTISPECIES: hypothetical protein [Priestia]SDE56997.1 hypothetical protein SAMN04487777_11653 [Priestia aryabhattai B8W22]MCR8866087.1 hypothetical protein [Priestia megaterium]MCU7766532.1 hypothetical protein [Priestia megaterium]MDC7783625.1 hypothetical protein [Priestia megaterium]MDR7206538.1 hypothetical protein [Priestia megaterium]